MFDVPGPITTTCVASGMALHMKTILLLLSSISVAYQLQICAVWGDKQGDARCVKANAAGAWNPRWWLDPKGIGSASEEAILATRRFPSVSIMDEDAAEVSTSNLAFCDRASRSKDDRATTAPCPHTARRSLTTCLSRQIRQEEGLPASDAWGCPRKRTFRKERREVVSDLL